jgi:putative ABC transport system permease protein
MFKVSLQSLLSHKLRLILTTLAIVIGVSSVAGTFIFVDTINATFTSIFQNANTGVAVTIRGHVLRGDSGGIGGGGRQPVPRALVNTVRPVAGVKDAVGVLFRNGATMIGADGKPIGGNGPPTFGANWIDDSEISPYRLRSGSAPRAADDVVIDAVTAAGHHLVVGQRVSIAFTSAPEQQFTITGIAGYGSSDTLAGATIALFTETTAERVLDGQDKYDAIDVSAQSGVNDTSLRNAIAATLPPYAEAATGQDAAAAAVQSTENTISTFIGTPLLVFAFIFLFVGSFLIVNTFNILVAQRTRELALLRALGASRRQVLTSVLVEATVTGLVASVLGVLLGIVIASLLDALINAPPNTSLSLQPRSFIIGMVVGVVVTLLAATFPARRATRVPPVAALREALPEIQSLSRARVIGGAVTLLVGCALLGVGLSGATSASLELLGAGVLLIFLGVASLAPLVVGPVAIVLGWPVRRLRGAAGLLARENARRNPRRTALTSAALMIGLALVTTVAVLTASFRASADAAIEGALRGDLLIFGRQGAGFSPGVAAALQNDSKLRDITELRFSNILIGAASQSITAVDPGALNRTLAFDMVSGDASSINTTNTSIVDQAEASSRHLKVGDMVTVGFPAGADVPMRIGGIYKQNALAQGYVVSLTTLAPNVTSALDFFVLVNAAPGVSLGDAEASLKHDLQAFPLLRAMSRAEYRDFTAMQIDQLLNLITGLLFLAVVIAVLGIVNTLALSVLERTREIGLLRALGLTRSQTRTMVRWESVLIAMIGAVLGLAVGIGLGLALTNALHDTGIDHVAIPGGNLIYYALVAGVFGVLAAIFPAIRAARLDVLQAIATE